MTDEDYGPRKSNRTWFVSNVRKNEDAVIGAYKSACILELRDLKSTSSQRYNLSRQRRYSCRNEISIRNCLWPGSSWIYGMPDDRSSSNNPANRFKYIQNHSSIYTRILSPCYNSHGITIGLVVVTSFVFKYIRLSRVTSDLRELMNDLGKSACLFAREQNIWQEGNHISSNRSIFHVNVIANRTCVNTTLTWKRTLEIII